MKSLASEDYEVYSAVLSTFFAGYPSMRILDRTGCSRRWEEFGIEAGLIRIRKLLCDNPELVPDFQASNTDAGVVEDRFAASVDHTVASSSDGSAGWQLSRVGYSRNGRYALVMIAHIGRHGGATSGILLLCQQQDPGWSCEKLAEWCS